MCYVHLTTHRYHILNDEAIVEGMKSMLFNIGRVVKLNQKAQSNLFYKKDDIESCLRVFGPLKYIVAQNRPLLFAVLLLASEMQFPD